MKRFLVLMIGLAFLAVGQDDCRQDMDGDGYIGMDDCDDNNPEVYPDAPEVCNGIDDDCDRKVDEDFDADGDGFSTCDLEDNPADCNDDYAGTFPGAIELCDGEDNNCDGEIDEDFDADNDGHTICTGDCDDLDPEVHPDAEELCDFFDNNCNGLIDETFDQDMDGYTTCAGDCDDTDPTTYVGASDVCDGVDNNCNGLTDEDWDGDGDGVTSCGGDCNDTNPAIFTGAPEICDGLDNNCDGQVDEGVLVTWYLDADNDGFGNPDTAVTGCSAPSEFYIVHDGDCNDLDPAINPDAIEACDAIDNNCDGQVDEGFDADGDGVTTCAGDCNDGDSSIYPGAPDICDGIDSDCGGEVEETCSAPVAEAVMIAEGTDADVLMNIAFGTEPLTVYFDATSSYDPDGGEIVSFSWEFGDGTTAEGPNVNHVYNAEAPDVATTYVVALTVTDDEGEVTVKNLGIRVCGAEYPDDCGPLN